MLEPDPALPAAASHGHAAGGRRRQAAVDVDLPEAPALPYRSELLVTIADWVHQWNSPEFSMDMVATVDPRLSVPAARILTRLFAQGPVRPSDLATQLHTGASNISKLMAQLEALGYIERKPDTGDARVVRVHLTDTGRDAAEGITVQADRAIAFMVGDWTEEEIRTYTAQTRRIAAAGRAYVQVLRSAAAEA